MCGCSSAMHNAAVFHAPDRDAIVRQLFDLLQNDAKKNLYPFSGAPPKPQRSKPVAGATSWDMAVDEKRQALLAQRPGLPPAPRASGVARWRVSPSNGNIVWRQSPKPGPVKLASSLHHADASTLRAAGPASSSSAPALSPRAFAESVAAAAHGRSSPTASVCTECGGGEGSGGSGRGIARDPGAAIVSNQLFFEPSNLRQTLSRQLLDAYPHEKPLDLTLPPRRRWLVPAGLTSSSERPPPTPANLTRPTRMHLVSTKPREILGVASPSLAASLAASAAPRVPTRHISRSASAPLHQRPMHQRPNEHGPQGQQAHATGSSTRMPPEQSPARSLAMELRALQPTIPWDTRIPPGMESVSQPLDSATSLVHSSLVHSSLDSAAAHTSSTCTCTEPSGGSQPLDPKAIATELRARQPAMPWANGSRPALDVALDMEPWQVVVSPPVAQSLGLLAVVDERKLSHAPAVGVATESHVPHSCHTHSFHSFPAASAATDEMGGRRSSRGSCGNGGVDAPLDDAAAVEHALRLAQQAASGRILSPHEVADMLRVAESLRRPLGAVVGDDVLREHGWRRHDTAPVTAHTSSTCTCTEPSGGSQPLDPKAIATELRARQPANPWLTRHVSDAATSPCAAMPAAPAAVAVAAAAPAPAPASLAHVSPRSADPSPENLGECLTTEEQLPLAPGSLGEQRARRWQLEQALRAEAWTASRQRQLHEQARMHDLAVAVELVELTSNLRAISPQHAASPQLAASPRAASRGAVGGHEKRPTPHVLSQSAPRPRRPYQAGPWATPMRPRPPSSSSGRIGAAPGPGAPVPLDIHLCRSASFAEGDTRGRCSSAVPSAVRSAGDASAPAEVRSHVSSSSADVRTAGGAQCAHLPFTPLTHSFTPPRAAAYATAAPSHAGTGGVRAVPDTGAYFDSRQADVAGAGRIEGQTQLGACSHAAHAHGSDEADEDEDEYSHESSGRSWEMTPEQMLAEELAMFAQAEAAAQAAAAVDGVQEEEIMAASARAPPCTPSMRLWGKSTAEAVATATAVSVAVPGCHR